jgi:signal transduction histidine kinase
MPASDGSRGARRRAPPPEFAGLPPGGEISALWLDAELRVVAASPGTRELFQIDPEALVGRDAAELLTPLSPLPEMSQGSLEVFAKGLGRPRRVRLFWSRQGNKVEALLLDLERAASGPFAQAAAVSRFASMLTHEVRNPLSSVKMVIQTLERSGGLDDRSRKRLLIAAREVRTMERILSALVELAHEPPLRRRPAELGALVQEALHLSEQELADRGLTPKLDVPQGLALFCDADRLVLAISHVLAHAARAVTAGELSVGAQREGERLRLVIGGASSGPAAPPSGSGISLAMVDKIAREHGGEFSVEESPAACAYSLLLSAGP